MSAQENPKFFGKMGISDFFLICMGGGASSNFASQFALQFQLARDPQTIVYLSIGAALLGFIVTRYLMVAIVRYMNVNFDNNPKKGIFIKIAYFLCFLIFITAFVVSKVRLDQGLEDRRSDPKTNDAAIEEMLQMVISQTKAKLPTNIDPRTRADSIAGGNRNLRINFTLLEHSSFDLTERQFRNVLQKDLENRICTHPDLLPLIKNGVTISWAYYGNDGKLIAVISVSHSQCSNT